MTRKTGPAGRALIKRFEGLRLNAYRCPAGRWTIGWGHTASATAGMSITEAQAEEMLSRDLAGAERAVERLFPVALSDAQHGALVAWVFNVGEGAAKISTLRKMLLAGRYDDVPAQLARWAYVTEGGAKVKSKGLMRRRAAEAELWASDDTSPMPIERPANPERTSPTRSKTLQAGALGTVAMIGGAVESAMSADWRTVAVLAVAALAIGYMMRERLKAWAEGWT